MDHSYSKPATEAFCYRADRFDVLYNIQSNTSITDFADESSLKDPVTNHNQSDGEENPIIVVDDEVSVQDEGIRLVIDDQLYVLAADAIPPFIHQNRHDDFTPSNPGSNILVQMENESMLTHKDVVANRGHPDRNLECEDRVPNNESPVLQDRAGICVICKKTFCDVNTLERHMKWSHTGVRRFTCMECGKSFITRWCLKRHSKTHTGVKPFSCELCGVKFCERGNLNAHFKLMHMKEKRFSCGVCRKGFYWNKDLNVHLKTHKKEELLLIRNRVTKTSTNKLDKTKTYIIVNSNDDSFYCKVEEYSSKHESERSFSRGTSSKKSNARKILTKHVITHTSTNFQSNKSFETHTEEKHPDEVILSPDVSHEKSLTKNKLNNTLIDMQSNGQSVLSEVLGEKVNAKSNSVSHMNLHTRKEFFRYDVCENGFLRDHQLNDHIGLHSAKRSFTCKNCNSTFCFESSLHRHIKMVHGEGRQLLCHLCNRRFFTKQKLLRHIKTHMSAKNGSEDTVDAKVPEKTLVVKRMQVRRQKKHDIKAALIDACRREVRIVLTRCEELEEFRGKGNLVGENHLPTRMQKVQSPSCDLTPRPVSLLKLPKIDHEDELLVTKEEPLMEDDVPCRVWKQEETIELPKNLLTIQSLLTSKSLDLPGEEQFLKLGSDSASQFDHRKVLKDSTWCRSADKLTHNTLNFGFGTMIGKICQESRAPS
ncbi:hypothetical protein QAD02_018020 [Eretmocerus hayati]|uniref:Uncharacterized protein n=1 Tax=Eretmocerus hayati TaxID=131215 RepID=A0ACC2PGQ9_9HYME|nr:hypothetical protein QAD02_018020 [Eretmocerus hayati]